MLLVLAFFAALSATYAAAAGMPFPPATPKEWTWVPIAGAKCMQGQPTGVFIKASPTPGQKKLAVYFEGGGACFNLFTCATARDEPHPSAPGTGGEFDISDPRNPYRDYNWIWIPYCSGDVHAGDSHHEFEDEDRFFSGRNNVKLIMDRAVSLPSSSSVPRRALFLF
jgi:Pectinacetylesterase